MLRRVIRRALRHGRYLGLDRPFLHEVAVSVMESMQDAYPELLENKNFITRVIHHEEERFNETLDFGLKLLQTEIKRLRDDGARVIPGALIFKLYDTFGFPIDIITDTARSLSMAVDEPGFNELMDHQREAVPDSTGRGAASGKFRKPTGNWPRRGFRPSSWATSTWMRIRPCWPWLREESPSRKPPRGQAWKSSRPRTPFYGESGGQVGDLGEISWASGKAVVTDTHKLPGDIFVHMAKVEAGETPGGGTRSNSRWTMRAAAIPNSITLPRTFCTRCSERCWGTT